MIVLVDAEGRKDVPTHQKGDYFSASPSTNNNFAIRRSFQNRRYCFQGYPCKETCDEIEKACVKELLVFLEFNVCGFYPLQRDDPTCFRPVVTCPKPCAPTHGSVRYSNIILWSKAVYDCSFLFNLEGDRTRICQVRLEFSIWC